jgi:hypothetical protein
MEVFMDFFLVEKEYCASMLTYYGISGPLMN